MYLWITTAPHNAHRYTRTVEGERNNKMYRYIQCMYAFSYAIHALTDSYECPCTHTYTIHVHLTRTPYVVYLYTYLSTYLHTYLPAAFSCASEVLGLAGRQLGDLVFTTRCTPLQWPGWPTKLTESVQSIAEVTMQGNDETELASALSQQGYQLSLRTVLKGRKFVGDLPLLLASKLQYSIDKGVIELLERSGTSCFASIWSFSAWKPGNRWTTLFTFLYRNTTEQFTTSNISSIHNTTITNNRGPASRMGRSLWIIQPVSLYLYLSLSWRNRIVP